MPDNSHSPTPTGSGQPDGGELEQGELDLRRCAKNAALPRPNSEGSFLVALPAKGAAGTPVQTIIPFNQGGKAVLAPVGEAPSEATGAMPPMVDTTRTGAEPAAPAEAAAPKTAVEVARPALSCYARLKGVMKDCCAVVPKVGQMFEWGIHRTGDLVDVVNRLITGGVIPLVKAVEGFLTAACAAALVVAVGCLLEASAPAAKEPNSGTVPATSAAGEPSSTSVPDVWKRIENVSLEFKVLAALASVFGFLFHRKLNRVTAKLNSGDEPKSKPTTTPEAAPADEK